MQSNFETTSKLDFNDSHQNINKAVHFSQRSSFMFQYFPPIFSLARLRYIASEAVTLRMQIWMLKMHGNYKQATITLLSMSHTIKGRAACSQNKKPRGIAEAFNTRIYRKPYVEKHCAVRYGNLITWLPCDESCFC